MCPAFLRAILDALGETLLRAGRVEFKGAGHAAPQDRGDPDRIAKELRVFFTGTTAFSDDRPTG